MTWFKVDDSFHSHPKVLAASPAALGLWVVAGSWCGANLSDGFVPDHVLPRLLPDSESLAQQLITAGLWRRARGGYRFHDWGDFNPKREDVEEERRKARERMRKLREGGKGAGQRMDGSPEQQAHVRANFATPTRPDPINRGHSPSVGSDRARESSEPPSPTCEEHQGNPNPPPCGKCADARRSRDRWEAERAQRIAEAPHCRRHRGQLAHNCAPCRSERLAAGIRDVP